MADVKWIKIVVDIFDDDKIKLIEALPDGDSVIVCWFKLLCLAGQKNNLGVLMMNERIAYTDEMLATIFRRPLQTVRLALHTFEQFGMIEIVNGAITIPNWGKHQSLDEMERMKEQNRLRQKKWYDKQKLLAEPNVIPNADLTQSNGTDIEKEKNQKKNKNVFVPPTLEEVAAYVKERGNSVDPQKFIDYYAANQWKDQSGKPVNNWKQKMIAVWEKDEKKKQYTTAAQYKKPTVSNDNYEEKLRHIKEAMPGVVE